MSVYPGIPSGSIGTLLPPGLQISPALLDALTLGEQETLTGPSVHTEVEELMVKGGDYDADIIMIGSGPGGYVGAIRAGQLGARIICIEKSLTGGTCLNIGCIPTKVLLASCEVLNHIKHSEEFGFKVDGWSINYDKMMDRKDRVVKQFRSGVEALFKKNKVQYVRGKGKIVDRNTVEVTSDRGVERFTARNIIIATGSRPGLLPLPGFEIGDKVWTSDEALAIREIPKSMVVIGGGAIGLEFGYMYSVLGTDVTVIELMPQLLPAADADVAKELEKQLKKTGLKIITRAGVTKAEDIKGGKRVFVKGPDGETQIDCEKILVAVGRKAVLEDIGLEEVGVKTERGRVIVDDHMRTNIPGIYAIGDIIGEPMLAHVAWTEGITAVENCMGMDVAMSYKAFPSCVYTNPEVASVGLTEQQAREQYPDVRIGTFPFSINGKALAIGEGRGFIKMISEPKYGEILGVHLVGPHVTDLIAELVLAMQSEATVDEIIAAIHPHPTLSEVVQEAALDTKGEALHKV